MDTLLGTSVGVFIGLTVIIVGGAAVMTGGALGESWRPVWQVVLASLGLALTDRFLVYALFGGELLHLPGFLVSFALLLGLALLTYRVTRVHKVVRQYPWKYERVSLWSYREKPGQI
jgi:hypothetical protein